MIKIIGKNNKLYSNYKEISYIDFEHFANTCKGEMSKKISFKKKKDESLFKATLFNEEVSTGAIKLLDRVFPFLISLLAVFLAVFPAILEEYIVSMIVVESIFGVLSLLVLIFWLKVIQMQKHLEIDVFTNLRNIYDKSLNAHDESNKFSIVISIDKENYDRREIITLLRRTSHDPFAEENFNVFIKSKQYEKEITNIAKEIVHTNFYRH
ncbi:hypothetical protein FACS1894166_06830 [Bacilli bacterium]|nr:hypothetical protein FACS1894166_06830 [Bacilli bacterium]